MIATSHELPTPLATSYNKQHAVIDSQLEQQMRCTLHCRNPPGDRLISQVSRTADGTYADDISPEPQSAS